MTVSVIATALGFSDLRMANGDKDSLSLAEAIPIWLVTVFVILTMVAALNAFLGVGMRTRKTVSLKEEQAGLKGRISKSVLTLRGLALVFYLFFAFWSIGFGYGFFWKELAGQEYTRNQFGLAIEDVSASVANATDALETVESSVIAAATTARERAEVEAAQGGTCSNRPNSVPGDGPLTRARFAFADRAQALRDDVSARWLNRLSGDRRELAFRLQALTTGLAPEVENATDEERALLQKLAIAPRLTSKERERIFTKVFDDARAFTAKANALRAANAPLYASRLDDLAALVGPDPNNPSRPDPARASDSAYCWDTVLTEQLETSAQSLRSLDDMATPQFEFLEGPKATRAAFFELASIPAKLSKSEEITFGEKEFIALFASIAVDLGILFLTLVRAAMETRLLRGHAARRPTPMRLGDVREAAQEYQFGKLEKDKPSA